MINQQLIRISILVFFIGSLVFTLWPSLDIQASNWCYSQDEGFVYQNSSWVLFFYQIIPYMTTILVTSCLVSLIYLGIRFQKIRKIMSSGAFFLLLTVLISPGLIVNTVLKENIGRARPRSIVEFGGSKSFSGSFVCADQCASNCSCSSGHAAMGFWFSAFAYVASYLYFTRIYLLGVLFGVLVGLSRIVMGGHFTSDVLISGFIVLLFNHLIYLLWKRKFVT
ncbi:MAG: phosphatase PAP2 family protein [Rickettsiaceae bacterium]